MRNILALFLHVHRVQRISYDVHLSKDGAQDKRLRIVTATAKEIKEVEAEDE